MINVNVHFPLIFLCTLWPAVLPWRMLSCNMMHWCCILFGGYRAQRAAKEAKDAPAQPAPEKPRVDIKRFVKIGRPGYKVTKQRDPDTGQQSLLFQVINFDDLLATPPSRIVFDRSVYVYMFTGGCILQLACHRVLWIFKMNFLIGLLCSVFHKTLSISTVGYSSQLGNCIATVSKHNRRDVCLNLLASGYINGYSHS